MKCEVINQANSYLKYNRQKQTRSLVFITLALLVSLGVTFSLIMPALTQEQEVFCGYEEHTHTDGCLQDSGKMSPSLSCSLKVHQHQPECFDADGNVVCGYADYLLHTHNQYCYDENKSLVCGLSEISPHVHEDSCYITQNVVHEATIEGMEFTTALICPMTEESDHKHTDECYDTFLTLVYEPFDAEPDPERELVCGIQEVEIHTHESACFNSYGDLTCGLLETLNHVHSPECMPPETDTQPIFSCTLEEHTHSKQCFSNQEADKETPEIWERTLPDNLSDIWSDNLLRVARSQLGYSESANNYFVQDDGTVQGYTRYGDWSGSPYDNWSALFVSFCLDASNIPQELFPQHVTCHEWLEHLKEKNEFFRTAQDYTPVPGDLIFFDFSEQNNENFLSRRANHMGIVTDVIDGEDASELTIQTIEGDSNNSVASNTYKINDTSILGYAALPTMSSPQEEVPEIKSLFYKGEDYRIEVFFTEDAQFPADVTLSAEEIYAGTEEYDLYYSETMASFPADAHPEFCRFFDVTFSSDGIEVEPSAPVTVNIFYDEMLPDLTGDFHVIHFADDGTELIDADLDITEEGGSTFVFTQNSFSVVGTVVMAATNTDNGYFLKVNTIDDPSAYYLIVFEGGDTQYALGATKSGISYKTCSTAVLTTPYRDFNDLYTCSSVSDNYLWKFSSAISGTGTASVKNKSYSKYLNFNSTNLVGNSFSCTLSCDSEGYWAISGSNRYLSCSNGFFSKSNSYDSSACFTVYKYMESLPEYTIWLDGTNGNNVMQLKGSDNTKAVVTAADNYTYTLPDSWASPDKYAYRLNGWYDIYGGKYYSPGEQIKVTENTVFYADWVSDTYDVGQNNSHVVGNLDTSRFITTHVFDYGVLFNAMSANATGTITGDSHSETWSLVTSGPVKYQSQNTLGITFRDWDTGNKSITYVNGYDSLLSGGLSINNNQGKEITSNILATSNRLSGGDLINTFFGTHNGFDPIDKTGIIGKKYLGTGNYLYQYMDTTTDCYDSEHNGYYYYDSRLNAASYNQSNQRFYVYDYLERTSDSLKDGGAGNYSDFLPFNSPYANTNGKTINTYKVPGNSGANYQYDAKYNSNEGNVPCTPSNVGTNYGFGISSSVNFYLPADSGIRDDRGEYINQSISGQDLTFEFSGDDDVWVFVDGDLVLDIGGLHGIIQGSINFSTGEVLTNGKSSFHSFDAGEHTLTFYYLERGGSQSNCAIYFNIAPRYSLDITKIDLETQEHLSGAEFTVYTDENCTMPADQLWVSKQAHDNYQNTQSTFVCDQDGVASCWGLIPGQIYYVKETKAPLDRRYTEAGGVVKVSLDGSGNATYEAVKVNGPEGFTVQGFVVDATKKELQLGITNKVSNESPVVQLNVQKLWSDGNEVHQNDSVTIHLLQDEKEIDSVLLNAENNWSHTFEDLLFSVTDETNVTHTYTYFVTEDPVTNYLPDYSDAVYSDGVYTITVTNTPVYELPETGGIGTYAYTLSGLIVILGVFVISFAGKHKEKYPKS